MKLSAARQEIVGNKLKMNQQELARKYNSEVDEFKREWNVRDRTHKINNKHLDHMQGIADFLVRAYLDAYEAESRIIGDEDKTEIILNLTALLNKKTYDRDLNLPESHTLANDTEGGSNRYSERCGTVLTKR
jgi:hypothetical protein